MGAHMGTAHARGLHGHHATHHGHLGLPLGYQPQQPMTPQFNDPGPKLWVRCRSQFHASVCQRSRHGR
jgi:hypothetical protein